MSGGSNTAMTASKKSCQTTTAKRRGRTAVRVKVFTANNRQLETLRFLAVVLIQSRSEDAGVPIGVIAQMISKIFEKEEIKLLIKSLT